MTQVQSEGWKHTYGKTQNLYVLQYSACHFHSQHTQVSKKHLIFIQVVKKKLQIVDKCYLSKTKLSEASVNLAFY